MQQLDNLSSNNDETSLDHLVVDNDVVKTRRPTSGARRPNHISSKMAFSNAPNDLTPPASARSSSKNCHLGNDEPDDVVDSPLSDSDGSSLGSTITATTVRTAINKARQIKQFLDDIPIATNNGTTSGAHPTGSSARSTSAMPAATARSRCGGQNQRTVARARSASQTNGGQRSVGQRSRQPVGRRANGTAVNVQN